MVFTTIPGGFTLPAEDKAIINQQRAITYKINQNFIQVGAVFLKTSGKSPVDEDWAERGYRETDLQSWIDDENLALTNAGFNLQLGWMDIDIDAEDPYYNEAIIAGLEYNGVDTRFRFGRKSVGHPSHVLVQLGEDEASNFEDLARFEPREFRIGDKRYHTQLRSYPTNISDKKNLYRSAKQTVMPGSVYLHKTRENEYDLSVWFTRNSVASNVQDIATTTPRRTNFNQVVRGIAFGTFVYALRDHWVEGQRQATVNKVAGWLARVVNDGEAINNHEALSRDVFCPVDSDEIAESLLAFAAEWFDDDEKHMRIRSYHDAREKLERNPDAKIPGWPAIETLLGPQTTNALRTTFTPGSDVSVLTDMAEKYLFDDTDGNYIDRYRHRMGQEIFVHEPGSLERRHIDETVIVNGKPRAAFRMFETSKMRIRVSGRNLYPELIPGSILRVSARDEVIADDAEDDGFVVFNTWRGWSLSSPAVVDEATLADVVRRIDQLFTYLTCDNPVQVEWIKKWIAWTIQHPAIKQQIAWVCVGGQGVGKSFVGNRLLAVLFGALWGTASPKIVDDKFNIGPFMDKMMVFVDEAKFHNESGTDEIKKLIRSVAVPGMEKFGEGRTYKLYARLMFASNRLDMNIGQSSVLDRALFYTKAYDSKHMGMTEIQFRAWADTLKPWFDEFDQLLNDRKFNEHMFHYFATLPVTKLEVESIQHSSSTDKRIVAANMMPSRRIAKQIIEEGFIVEDLSIEYQFRTQDLGARIEQLCRDNNVRPVRTDVVLQEFLDAEVCTREGFVYTMKYRHATLLEKFGAAISSEMDVLWTFGEDDYGPNTEPTKKKRWRGAKPGVVSGGGAF